MYKDDFYFNLLNFTDSDRRARPCADLRHHVSDLPFVSLEELCISENRLVSPEGRLRVNRSCRAEIVSLMRVGGILK